MQSRAKCVPQVYRMNLLGVTSVILKLMWVLIGKFAKTNTLLFLSMFILTWKVFFWMVIVIFDLN